MSTPTQVYLQKADQKLADLSAGGLAQPKQLERFYRTLYQKSELLAQLMNKQMSSDTLELDNATPDAVILQPGTESTALAADERSKMNFGKVLLTVAELVGECRWSYHVVEDNIENGNFENLVIDTFAEKVAANLEEIVIKGDTSIVVPAKGSTTTSIAAWRRARMLKVFDGILKRQVSHVVDADGVRLNKNVFKAAWQTMPSEYRSKRLQFFTSENAVADYWDSIADRQTPMGDAAYQQSGETQWQGKKVKSIALWPDDLGNDANMTVVSVFDPSTAWVGLHRNITLDRDRDIRAREYIAVWSLRAGFQFQHEPSTLKIENVRSDADL